MQIWSTVTENITNFPCYKTNLTFYKTEFCIMILTFHILKPVGYHNIEIDFDINFP